MATKIENIKVIKLRKPKSVAGIGITFTKQTHEVPIAVGILLLIDAPAGGHPQMIATGKLINGIPQAQAQIPIIFSETEKSKIDDWVTDGQRIAQINVLTINDPNRDKHYKVLVLPEQFSRKHLQAIVDGKMKNGDKFLVECVNVMKWSETYQEEKLHSAQIKLNPKGHVILHKSKEKNIDELVNKIMSVFEDEKYFDMGDYGSGSQDIEGAEKQVRIHLKQWLEKQK